MASDIQVSDVVIRANAYAFDQLRATRDSVEEQMERMADPLERAAHKILDGKAEGHRLRYTRAGQYPNLLSVDLLIGVANFKVSNGRDPSDDFEAVLLVKDLEAAYAE